MSAPWLSSLLRGRGHIRLGQQLFDLVLKLGGIEGAALDPADLAALINEEGLGDALDPVRLGDASSEIGPVQVSDVELCEIRQSFLLGIDPIDAQEDHPPPVIVAPGLL